MNRRLQQQKQTQKRGKQEKTEKQSEKVMKKAPTNKSNKFAKMRHQKKTRHIYMYVFSLFDEAVKLEEINARISEMIYFGALTLISGFRR